MPIHEGVLDALAHMMGHYFRDVPEAEDVDPDELAMYMEAHGVCEGCVDAFLRETGTTALPDAIATVWASAIWQASRHHHARPEETDGSSHAADDW